MNIVSAMGVGFLLALLIFIDQNIVVSLTNAPENRSVLDATEEPSLPTPNRENSPGSFPICEVSCAITLISLCKDHVCYLLYCYFSI